MLEEEPHPDRWRVIWVAAVALLRAIGHVLKTADCQNPHDRKVCDDLFLGWKSGEKNKIFRDLISSERNLVLKEYEFGFDGRNEIPVTIHGGPTSGAIFNLDENLFRPIQADWEQGEDARDVGREAIEWWEWQLNRFEELRSPN